MFSSSSYRLPMCLGFSGSFSGYWPQFSCLSIPWPQLEHSMASMLPQALCTLSMSLCHMLQPLPSTWHLPRRFPKISTLTLRPRSSSGQPASPVEARHLVTASLRVSLYRMTSFSYRSALSFSTLSLLARALLAPFRSRLTRAAIFAAASSLRLCSLSMAFFWIILSTDPPSFCAWERPLRYSSLPGSRSTAFLYAWTLSSYSLR
mmetsp:Transcript_25528/g.54743  ORF Transcript_25528/g.54743 Transcript_25528/m.54743 type:complete len:205 (-) Transcript_25528:415-1029(-)